MNVCIYHTSNITGLSNGSRQLTATFAKCNLHKWTLYIPVLIILNVQYTFFSFLWETLEKTPFNFKYITGQLFLLRLTLL